MTETTQSSIPSLSLAESFYSIQGEGVTSGVPAVFIRLRGCNLMCGGPGGSLMKEGKATWWCDTEAVWRQGKITPFTDLIESWKKEDILDWIATGRVHLVWTGGEPTMPKHQKDIVACIDWFNQYISDRAQNSNDAQDMAPLYYRRTFVAGKIKICQAMLFNELETNGTLEIGNELALRLTQVNCSPKLGNSGMSKEKRIVPAAIERIKELRHQFKFVVSNESDIVEIINDFVEPFELSPENVVLMPGLDAQANFHERTRFCLEAAKKYGFLGLTRLHVSAWDKTTGV